MSEDYDDPVYLDMQRIEESINSGEMIVPKGLTPEERRVWVSKYLYLNREQDPILKQLRDAYRCFECKGFGCDFCDQRGYFTEEV